VRSDPNLSALIADPVRAADVPTAAILTLLHALRAERTRLRAEEAGLEAVEDALVARLVENMNGEGDHLLTVDEAAKKLATTPDWLRRHADELGIVVRLSEGQVRCSALAIDRYIASRTGRPCPSC